MKLKLLWVCSLWLGGAWIIGAEEPGPEIRLRGIVEFSTNRLALLEATALPGWPGEMILAEGQREGAIELLEIDGASTKVKIRNAGVISEISFRTELPPGAWVQSSASGQRVEPLARQAFLRLQQAAPKHVFNLYQLLAGRSLIRSQSLPGFRLDLGCKDAATTDDLVKAIEQALAPKGILFRPDGDKFAFAGRENDLNCITPELRELAATLANTRKNAVPGNQEELLPVGAINFPGTDLNQVLMIYQELVNRSLLRPVTLPAPTVALRNCTSWTIAEAIYAFNASFAMNGVSVAAVGKKLLFAFPTVQKQKMDDLLKWRMPVHPLSGKEPLPTAVGGPPLSLRQIMAVYQELCGKPVEIEADLPFIRFIFRNQNLLTAEEVLHAWDLVLAWNGLEVTQNGEKGLKVSRREESK